jgi:hypothetical protein
MKPKEIIIAGIVIAVVAIVSYFLFMYGLIEAKETATAAGTPA